VTDTDIRVCADCGEEYEHREGVHIDACDTCEAIYANSAYIELQERSFSECPFGD
jgi:ribosomal protein L37AE/L43A